MKIEPFREQSYDCATEVQKYKPCTYACTANRHRPGYDEDKPIKAWFDTSKLHGEAVLHYTTGLSVYPDMDVEYEVLINGEKVYTDSYNGAGPPYKVEIPFSLRSANEVVVEWRNTVSENKDWTYLFVGTEDCDLDTTEAYITPAPEKPMPLWQKAAIAGVITTTGYLILK